MTNRHERAVFGVSGVLRAPVTVFESSRKMSISKVNINTAVEHVRWCAKHQSDGYIPIRILRTSDSGEHTVDATQWFHNRDPRLAKKLSGFLTRYGRDRVAALYSPCAFSMKQAKAQYALPNQIAYVDADDGRSDKFRPEPTRIVKSSELGEHWFWLLSRPLPADELQALNKALTRKIGADAGGHSPAKLFRLPGFHNFKHEPAYRVSVFDDTGEIHDASSLLAIADLAAQRKPGNVIDIGNAMAAQRNLRPERILEKYWHKLCSNTRCRLRQRSICGPMGVTRNGLRVSAYPEMTDLKSCGA